MVLSNHSDTVGFSQVNETAPDSLGSIAINSQAGRTVFHALSGRVRFRRTTDLNRLYRFIVANEDDSMSEEQFLGVFKTLGNMNIGKLIIGRKNNPNRFRWNYNLKEAASAALGNKPMSELQTLPPKPRGPKKTRKTKAKRKTRMKRQAKPVFSTPSTIQPVETAPIAMERPSVVINITVPPGTSAQDLKALVDLAKGLGS